MRLSAGGGRRAVVDEALTGRRGHDPGHQRLRRSGADRAGAAPRVAMVGGNGREHVAVVRPGHPEVSARPHGDVRELVVEVAPGDAAGNWLDLPGESAVVRDGDKR